MARSKTKGEDVTSFALRLPRDLHAELMALAEKHGLSMNEIMVRMLKKTSEELKNKEPVI